MSSKKTGEMKKRTKMMNGKTKQGEFEKLYNLQLGNQQELLNKGKYDDYTAKTFVGDKLPKDDVSLFSYHIQQLVSEIGELLQSDKRWKSFRRDLPDVENKKEEIADCLIVLLNIAIFSGIKCDELYDAVESKMLEVKERIEKEG